MKILHLIQRPQLRGAEIAAMRSAVQLEKNGCEVVVASLFKGDSILDYPVKQIHLGLDFKRRFWSFKAWRELAKMVADQQFDVVQANAGFTLKFAVFSKIIFGWRAPIVFRNASTISRYIRTPFSLWFNKLFFRKAKSIISVSETSAKDFVKLYPGMSPKVSVVPVGIDDTLKVQKAKTKKGTGPVILHVGGFTYEKNHEGLLRIFKNILTHHPNATLRLAGDGPLRCRIEEAAEEMELSRVQFLGNCPNVNELFSEATVLVLPSIIEGLPSVLLEAFFFHVPVVAYNVGGVSEVVENEKSGFLIPEGDEDAFAAAVCRIIEEPRQVELMVANANQLVCTHYMNEQLVQRTLAIYKSITAVKHTPMAHQLS